MVFNKKYCFLVLSVVLVLVTKQSNANEDAPQKCINEFDTKSADEGFRDRHSNALEVIQEINQLADESSQKVEKENEKKAIELIRKGAIGSTKCVAISGEKGYDVKLLAEKSDTKSSENEIKIANKNAKQTTGVAGLYYYLLLGQAGELTGNYSTSKIIDAIEYVTRAGQQSYTGLDFARKIANVGLEAGGSAKQQSLNAAVEGVNATLANSYNSLKISARTALKGIDRSEPSTSEDSFDGPAGAAEKSSEASSAIESVKQNAQSAAKEGPNSDAVNIIKEGIIAAIKTFAAAIEKGQDELKAAQTSDSSGDDTHNRKIFKQLKFDIAFAAAKAYYNIGRATQKVGKEKSDQLDDSVTHVEKGRGAAYNLIESAAYYIFEGIQNGETASDLAFKTAHSTLQAAAFAAYAELVKASESAFNALRS